LEDSPACHIQVSQRNFCEEQLDVQNIIIGLSETDSEINTP